MAQYGVVHYFKGGTREQFENGLKVLHPDGGKSLLSASLDTTIIVWEMPERK